jgi:ubiquinone/menaquinone biosynthesis C-methylase UbiE
MGALGEWGIPETGAALYDTYFVAGMTGAWVPAGLTLAAPRPGEHVLDVACGTGIMTRALAAAVGPGGRVVGLDAGAHMLALARAREERRDDAVPIEWRDGDAARLPFAAETFDLVCCQFGLMLFPDQPPALREMRRVLKPGGRLALVTWGAIERCPGQAVMKATWTRHFGAEKAAIFGAQHALSDPDRVRALLRDAGFRGVTASAALGTARFASPEQLTGVYATALDIRADAATRDRVIAEVRDALRDYIGPDGLAYPIEAILGRARK